MNMSASVECNFGQTFLSCFLIFFATACSIGQPGELTPEEAIERHKQLESALAGIGF